MSSARTFLLTTLAMLAFAGNSLFCRIALKQTHIDAASFTTIRLTSGTIMLWLVARVRHRDQKGSGNHGFTKLMSDKNSEPQSPRHLHRTAIGAVQVRPQRKSKILAFLAVKLGEPGNVSANIVKPSSGDWTSAGALFIYAAGFSFAYTSLPAATGALLRFGAVQVTMLGYGIWSGERLRIGQLAGLLIAFGGFAALFLPGLSAPPLAGSLLMLSAGSAWGIYSLRGRGVDNPLKATLENFMRASLLAAMLSAAMIRSAALNTQGVWYAILSGAIASGIGYAIWYLVLPGLMATQAALVQLSVPVIASLGGILFLDEPVSLRLVIASAAILGGIAIVILEKQRSHDVRAGRVN